jgi:ribonuclease P protein component
MQLVTIKRRADFLRLRGGARASCAAFALEAKPRDETVKPPVLPPIARFGFTVTKKLGNAVVRNRIKRRLREAVRHSASPYCRPEFDYVLVARGAALARNFADLKGDIAVALQRLHAKDQPRRAPASD